MRTIESPINTLQDIKILDRFSCFLALDARDFACAVPGFGEVLTVAHVKGSKDF